MSRISIITGTTAASILGGTGCVYAHAGSAHDGGSLTAGLMHPILGFDHLLTLAVIGVLLACAQYSYRWCSIGIAFALLHVILNGSSRPEFLAGLIVSSVGMSLLGYLATVQAGRIMAGPDNLLLRQAGCSLAVIGAALTVF